MFLDYYKTSYCEENDRRDSADMKGARVTDLKRIHDVTQQFEAKKELYPNAKPFLFILPSVSRFMTTPGRPTDTEGDMLMVLFNTTQIASSPCRLMLFVDKMNDLPVWFESEGSNPAVKKITIPCPNTKFRETFFEVEMTDVMDEIVVSSNEETEDLREEDMRRKRGKKVGKFAVYTENYSLRRLLQLKAFIQNNGEQMPSFKRIESIDKTVLAFECGEVYDPWKDPALKENTRKFADEVKKKIKGQNHIVEAVADSLKAAATGVNSSKKNDRRPKAIFFLAGPTGTGKTEIAKQIAENIFHSQDKIIRFDMSEFSSEHTDSRLFGAPPGYVGYEDGGELTKAIREEPFSVVLFDEIEKASPRIWDKFLQILGDGRLTDGKGETVSFSQSIIIFTSNRGIAPNLPRDLPPAEKTNCINRYTQELNSRIAGFKSANEENKKDAALKAYETLKNLVIYSGLTTDYREHEFFKLCYSYLFDGKADSAIAAFNLFVEENVKESIRHYFEVDLQRKEILGRVGESNILVYKFIGEYNAKAIAKNTIEDFKESLRDENDSHLDLEISEDAARFIQDDVMRKEIIDLGARGIIDRVDFLMRDPIKDFLFENPEEGLSAIMKVVDGALVVELR
ncbi:MAG: ATP-dependent Clp protease ATP-binding subunit [Clostridia bacterium]|nr:ATP-dependent Clp protease ATP-binding subunit [Clostridia bacterium]